MSLSLLESLRVWMPELLLSVGALAVLLVGVSARRAAGAIVQVAWVTMIAAALSLWMIPTPVSVSGFYGLITLDPLSAVFRWLALGVVALTVLMLTSADDVEPQWRGEYVGLVLLVGVGVMLMAEAAHLLMAYVAVELVSLSSYCLVGLPKGQRAAEAAMKYLLFGALSSGIMLFGMSWIFGLTGALDFSAIAHAVDRLGQGMTDPASRAAYAGAMAMAVALVLVGLGFKISMVPFHMWTPDVYEGAPIPVAAMLSVGPKAAGLALLLRVTAAVSPMWGVIGPVMIGLAIVTMTLGNLVALVQHNAKRLFAYSTIAQVGYLLIGFSVKTPLAMEGLLVYLVAYLFMNLGAFACLTVVCTDAHDETLDAFRGLARRAPLLAACCAVFLLSLAGMPPLVGFMGKFLLFGSAIEADHLWLAVAAVINSAIALYYYVNIIRLMYLVAPERLQAVSSPWALRVAVGLCGIITLALGVFPNALLAWLGRVATMNLL